MGLEVSVGGRRGTITAVAAGRVRVDFNNPLAGKTLLYTFKALRKASTPEERVRAILDMDYGLAEQFKIDIKGDAADIRLPDVSKTDEKWFVSKFRAVADLREFTDLRLVRFVEEYEKRAEAKPEAKPAAEERAVKDGEEATPKKPAKKARRPRAEPKEAPPKAEPRPREKAPEEL